MSIRLERKLSERPTPEELEERNILKRGQASSSREDAESMEERKRLLLRKVGIFSMRLS